MVNGNICESPDMVMNGNIIESPEMVMNGNISESLDMVMNGNISESLDMVMNGNIIESPDMSWGADKEDLRIVYLAYIKSAIDYASNAWYPCLAKDRRQKLETVQNAAARTITGCTKNTNTKLLLNEAKLLPLEVESTISQSAAYERSLRLPETDPSRDTAENPVRTRLRSLGTWRETGKDKAYVCGLEDFPREKLVPVPDIPLWQVPETFTCCSTLGEGISKADAPEELKQAIEDTMEKLNKPDVEVFTDGSARDGGFFLGGGILVIEKEERHSLSIAAGRYGSSYRAESRALKKALNWLQERERERRHNKPILGLLVTCPKT
ncbi:reverse transcriptase (RNA-dependent DNA polymerase) [Elysia marginata]|uniref:Reverse transcriptase (RNA-dependent DNA polymerase) n=1 Tax=Elysia marginata TaxID=1093978 RepID=A0AAV4F1I2_9GAST|nr:reverse transcriptase (RNA-dependent DNA polymerase) [Elysia marginata]